MAVLCALLGAAIARTVIPLAALGYPKGIALDGGTVILRLPIHRGARRIGIRFPLDARGDSREAQVRVLIDGREVAEGAGEQLRGVTLAAEEAIPAGRESIDVALQSRFAQCGDAAPASQLRIDGSGTVIVMQDAEAARLPRETYAGAFTIIEPQHPDTAWRARALASAYALHVIDGWRRVTVSLGATPQPGSVSVTDVAALLPAPRASPGGTQTFGQLGVAPLAQSGENVAFVVPFTLGQLGGVANRVVATVRMNASAPGQIVATFNGREINRFALAAGSQTLRLPISSSSLRGTNSLRIEVRFDRPELFCGRTPPEIAIEDGSLSWSGQGDIPMTLERRIGELSGHVVVESDPAIFAQAFITMSALGTVNHTIDGIDMQPLQPNTSQPSEIEIGAAAPDVEPERPGSFGEVRVDSNGRIRVSYVGDPAVLDRLPQFAGTFANSDATSFEFGSTGAAITQGGPFRSYAQQRQRVRWIIYGAFIVVLVVGTALIARRARRFS